MPKDITIYEGRVARTFQGVKKIKTSGDTYWIPEDDANAEMDQAMSDLYNKYWGTVSVAGTTTLKSTLNYEPFVLSNTYSFSVNFTSNNTTYSSITIDRTGASLKVTYGSTTVYQNGSWTNNNYKALNITGGSDVSSPKLAYWLYDNDSGDYTSKERFEKCLNIIVRNYFDDAGLSTGATIKFFAETTLEY